MAVAPRSPQFGLAGAGASALGGPAGMGLYGLAQLAPFLIGLLGGNRGRIDPIEQARQLQTFYSGILEPARQQATQAAARTGVQTGARLSQDYASAAGRIGGGSSGNIRVGRSLASSAAGNRAASGAADANTAFAQALAQLVQGSLGTALGSPMAPPSRFQNFQSGLAGATAAGGNPFVALLDMIMKNPQALGGGGYGQRQGA